MMNDWINRRTSGRARMHPAAIDRGLQILREHVRAEQHATRRRQARPVTKRYFYDCEFIDDGRQIGLISIGIVCDDGRELYYVNADAPWRRIAKHSWLMHHVIPHLPGARTHLRLPKMWLIDHDDPRVQPRGVIAAEVERFLLNRPPVGTPAEPDRRDPDIELWADHAAYDHICLAQLWGPMADLPTGIPMWTNDLQQELRRLGNPQPPTQASGLHDALADARHLQIRYDWLQAYARSRSGPELLI